MATNTLNGMNMVFPIYNANGTPFNDLVLRKATVDSVVMSLSDKITGDVYYRNNNLAVTMQEYIEYKRNPDDENEDAVKYVLVNPPTIVREGMASDNGDMRGMTKYSFEFYHPMCQLSNIPFTDVAVTSNQEKYLSQNKTFSWMGNGFDLIAKLNKNLQGTQWVVIASTNQASLEKLAKFPSEISPNKAGEGEKSDVLSFDKNFISDALKTFYDNWEVPFVIDSLHEGEYYHTDANNNQIDYYTEGKRFVILFGLPSNEILDGNGDPFIFRFGQGVGLKNNSRTSKNNKIVTRIMGYGSENNIPFGYPQIPWYGDQSWKYTINNNPSAVGSYPIYKGIYGGRYVNLIKHPFTRKTLMPSIYSQTVFNKISPYLARVISSDETLNYMPLEDFTNHIDEVIESSAEGSVLYYAYSELLTVVQDVAMQGVEQTIGFGDAHTDQYEGTVTLYTNSAAKIIRGRLDADASSPDATYVFDMVLVEMTSAITPNPNFNPNTEIVDYYDADNSYTNPIVLSAPSVEVHQFEGIKPRLTNTTLAAVLPYDKEHEDAISYSEFITRINTFIDNAANENERHELTLYRDSINAGQTYCNYGESGGSYTWHEDQHTVDEYYYSIKYTSDNANFSFLVVRKGMTLPPITWDDTMDDNGKYIQSYFKMRLPVLDFDIYACASITEEMEINMRSGACIGCTFPIYVDWDVYKANFYHSDGSFDPVIHTTEGDGHVRNGNLFPDSSQGQIEVIVKKDLDTFGTLKPNIYQQPATGDQFVILGISLPISYITNAEQELDNTSKQYMRENNTYYFDYPLKFDEHFLTTNIDILAQIRNNTIVRFQYANELPMALYVKQMTVKYGDTPLPQYSITLTDDIEVVLNQIGQTTEDVSRMRVQLSEIQKFYAQNIIDALNEKLSKTVDDVCSGRITFQQGLDAIGSIILSEEIRSDNFQSGQTGHGWRIDQVGNAEMESLRVRSFLEVVELLINRLQAQEGDTLYTDNDQIDRVEQKTYNGTTYYILSLKEKWAGYFTSQQAGNIIKGVINTLAANYGHVSDVTESQCVEADGQNKYFTSWMFVIDPTTVGETLGTNQIAVQLYGDAYVPAQKNFPPCELMTIARWGCLDASPSASEEEKASVERRQRMFSISNTDGRITKLRGVNSPILQDANYGTTLGILPDFVRNWSGISSRLSPDRDYLYAQGIVVQDFIKVDVNGQPLVNYVDKGEWQTGVAYLSNAYNATTLQWETHDVWHNGSYWRCRVSQPYQGQYFEPTETNSTYWTKLLTSAITYKLQPSLSSINVGRTAQGGYDPQYITLKCGYVKTEGGVVTSVEEATGNIDNMYRIFFRRRTRSTGAWESSYFYYNNTTYNRWLVITEGYATSGLNTSVYDAVQFIIYEKTNSIIITQSGFNSTLVVDSSTVSVMADGENGTDGKDAQYIYLKGTARDVDGTITDMITPVVNVNGGSNLITASGRGLNLVTINRQTLAKVESINYDTWGQAAGESSTRITDLINKLNSLDNTVFVCLVSQDAIGWSNELITALQGYGMSDLPYTATGRYPFLFIGYKGLGKGNGLTRMRNVGAYTDVVELSAYIANGALTVKDGEKGATGTRGKTGRFFYYAGVWNDISSSASFVVSDAQAPYFRYGGTDEIPICFVYNPEANGTYTKSQMGTPSVQTEGWEIMTTDFKYLITQAMFSNFAKLASAIFSGDWMISQYGQPFMEIDTATRQNLYLFVEVDGQHTIDEIAAALWNPTTKDYNKNDAMWAEYENYGYTEQEIEDVVDVCVIAVDNNITYEQLMVMSNTSYQLFGADQTDLFKLFTPNIALDFLRGKAYLNDAFVRGDLTRPTLVIDRDNSAQYVALNDITAFPAYGDGMYIALPNTARTVTLLYAVDSHNDSPVNSKIFLMLPEIEEDEEGVEMTIINATPSGANITVTVISGMANVPGGGWGDPNRYFLNGIQEVFEATPSKLRMVVLERQKEIRLRAVKLGYRGWIALGSPYDISGTPVT